MSRTWKPSAFLTGSAALHAVAAVGAAALPGAWPWALGAVAANHALITAVGLLPRTDWLGPNITRLPDASVPEGGGRVALTIDDGPDPQVTPQVLDLLDECGMVASFFLIGHRAQRYPALCQEIVARGHRVENHGHSHSHAFSLFGPSRMRQDIARAQGVLSDLTGQAPRFFRPTAGLRNPFLDPVLAQLDLRLAAWTRRPYDTRDPHPERVLARLCRGLSDGDILLLHDGHAARTAEGQPVILSVIPMLAQRLTPNLRTVTLHEAIA